MKLRDEIRRAIVEWDRNSKKGTAPDEFIFLLSERERDSLADAIVERLKPIALDRDEYDAPWRTGRHSVDEPGPRGRVLYAANHEMVGAMDSNKLARRVSKAINDIAGLPDELRALMKIKVPVWDGGPGATSLPNLLQWSWPTNVAREATAFPIVTRLMLGDDGGPESSQDPGQPRAEGPAGT